MHPFQFRFFQRRHRSYCAKPTRTAWSGFGQTHLIWKQAGVQESSGPVSGRTQPARYQFPTFRLGSVLPQTSRIILMQNQPGSDLVLADCVRVWRNGSGPEASHCARIIRPASGQCFPADTDRMRIRSGLFTGLDCRLLHVSTAIVPL